MARAFIAEVMMQLMGIPPSAVSTCSLYPIQEADGVGCARQAADIGRPGRQVRPSDLRKAHRAFAVPAESSVAAASSLIAWPPTARWRRSGRARQRGVRRDLPTASCLAREAVSKGPKPLAKPRSFRRAGGPAQIAGREDTRRRMCQGKMASMEPGVGNHCDVCRPSHRRCWRDPEGLALFGKHERKGWAISRGPYPRPGGCRSDGTPASLETTADGGIWRHRGCHAAGQQTAGATVDSVQRLGRGSSRRRTTAL